MSNRPHPSELKNGDDMVPFSSVSAGSFIELYERVWRVTNLSTWDQATLVPYERTGDLDAIKVNRSGMVHLVRYPGNWS